MRSSLGRRTEQLRYFSTAQFCESRVDADGTLKYVPSSEVHAKEMGTVVTVCGARADNWVKLWTQPFDTNASRRCPACVDQLRQRRIGDGKW